MQKRLPGHFNHIGSLAFSPDGKQLASLGHAGGAIKLWSLDDKAAKPPAIPSRAF